jgi:hypothetical protein
LITAYCEALQTVAMASSVNGDIDYSLIDTQSH